MSWAATKASADATSPHPPKSRCACAYRDHEASEGPPSIRHSAQCWRNADCHDMTPATIRFRQPRSRSRRSPRWRGASGLQSFVDCRGPRSESRGASSDSQGSVRSPSRGTSAASVRVRVSTAPLAYSVFTRPWSSRSRPPPGNPGLPPKRPGWVTGSGKKSELRRNTQPNGTTLEQGHLNRPTQRRIGRRCGQLTCPVEQVVNVAL